MSKRILFSWSAGGACGLDIHMGIWMALWQRGITSTENIGTSAGSVIAAMDSTDEEPIGFHRILKTLKASDIRRKRWFWRLRIPFGLNYWCSSKPLARQLECVLPAYFGDLKKRCRVCLTREATGTERIIETGDLRRVVLASMSIAGVYPPIMFDEDWHSDGGTTNYIPLPPDWDSFDELWLLIANPPLDYKDRDKGIISRLMQNMVWMMEDQVRDVLRRVEGNPKVRVIRPELETPAGALRFDHDLIHEAREWTLDKLEASDD